MLGPRKNNEVLTLDLTDDVVDAIRWHIQQGYAGPELLFSNDWHFPTRIYSHAWPLRAVQRAQLRIVADLEPSSPPHGTPTAPG